MTHYQLVAQNKRKSWLVIVGFTIFVGVAAWLMTYSFGYDLSLVGVALIFSGMISFGSYWFSDTVVLAVSKARPATREEFFDFYTVAENLSMSLQIPVPKLYVIDDTAMNAFATGRDPKHSAVVATTGLLSRLDRGEIEGVVAHELAHVTNYDILLMSIVSILVGFIALLADWMLRISFLGGGKRRDSRDSGQIEMILGLVGFVLVLLSPLIANLIKLAISRKREFLADASGVAITKNPMGLISALSKISQDQEPLEAANKATAHLYISDPLKNQKGGVGWFANMFNTHPPVEERIQALQSIVV
ncbi:MAG TPA: M48 family metallopeptidase [Candidatus Woesebacteria bacterium]|nr:M48 family metallopeptidase [Candidatus Woesebacteria bacterium]HNS65255.1 M48 family metallopeptidase [Candidatus Woesebacteria bacterium]